MRKPYFLLKTPPTTPEPAEKLAPWAETTVVGKPLPRVDAYERVSGSAVYALDLFLPDMLYAAILRCPHAHAIVKKVDTAAATKMPGVRAVLTDSDTEARIPWYFTEKGPTSRLFDPHCRYEGEEIAAVAAETPHQAADALRAIVVEYEELPFVVDLDSALKPGAPLIHEGGNQVEGTLVYERGDIAKGFADAEAIVERTFRTSCEIHTPMEVHGSVAKWDGNRLTVWDTTQGVFQVQQSLADALRLPLSNVRVIGQYMGGGFGSKLEISKHTVIAAILARKTARPVKLFISREESFLCVGNRPANTMSLKAGVRKDGTLTAMHLINRGAVGAYPGWAGVGSQVADLYTCAHVRVEETCGHINAGQERAFRAPGFPQCSWALEQVMDELAAAIGLDPVEFRLTSIPVVSQRQGGKPYTSTGLRQCLVEGARAFGWDAARGGHRRNGPWLRGAGVAACQWGWPGGPPSTVIVRYFADGSVSLNMGASDIGTGTKTIMAMVVAEELGVALDRIQIEHADTGTTQYATPSGGSKTVPSDSPAVRAAAVAVKRKLLAMGAEQLEAAEDEVVLKAGEILVAGSPDKKVRLAELEGLMNQQVVIGVGHREQNPLDKVTKPFGAQFAEVEVNERTGEVRILRLLGAHDSGRVMNRLTYQNQVFGGMTMGIGFGMTERRVLDRQTGKMVNSNWHDYKIPTAMDVPADLTCVPIDVPDNEFNSTGTKGLGEPATIPTAAAIANAVYAATGIRVTDAPINPTQLASLLADQRKRG
ncbi:MAG: xanthine dehydrogenase family protein molybdopterin-binding subunit [Acidobacteria bacterium]|nr:xanthine dehydrogenase family protein molybdopterin-binding subunit [Acidobacteriota bacterium]